MDHEAQQDALEWTLLPWVTPDRADDLARLLNHGHDVALDTALIGSVIAHESDGWTNKFHWERGAPGAKDDAGWPRGLWLPPAGLDAAAEQIVRQRTREPDDVDRTIAWAHWQISNWWNLAAMFADGAVVTAIDNAGQAAGLAAVPASAPSPHSTGEIAYADDFADPHDGRCVATWSYHALLDEVTSVFDRNCPLWAAPGDLLCRVHRAANVL